MNRRFAAVIPCFNEEFKIHRVLDQLRQLKVFALVIDDASSDQSAAVAKEYGAHVISHKENRGYTSAILTGFNHLIETDYEYYITIDGDSAHNALNLSTLLSLRPTADMLVGDRFCSGSINFFETKMIVNMLGSKLFYGSIGGKSEKEFDDITSGLRVFRRDFAARLISDAANCTPFGFCYFTLKVADVTYDARRLLHTSTGELENFLEEMTNYCGKSRYLDVVSTVRNKVLSKESFLFFIDRDLFSATWVNEVDGYVFQRSSVEYLREIDVHQTIVV